ncbi:MAG: AtpZ/AtpI family protein [Gemmataceae bacterium]|nr:AtpZ/AtpI family protein [Gemmataceae bacterium]
MTERMPDPREVGRYFALAMVGLEMVVPIGVGYWLDNSFGWSPWGVTVGAILGLVLGLYHLVKLSKQFDKTDPHNPPRDRL